MQTKNARVPLGPDSRNLILSQLDALASKHPIAKKAASHVGDTFMVASAENVAALKARAESAANWTHLNDVGKRAARMEALKPPYVEYAKSRLALKALRSTLSSTLPKVGDREPGDLAGEMRDQEIRAWVRSLPHEKRDTLEHSVQIASAIARAPAELSGVSPSVHEHLRSKIIEAERPDDIANWRSADEALRIADEALNEVEKDLYAGADFAHDGEYRNFIEQHVRPEVEK
jgi:hypothetical protein